MEIILENKPFCPLCKERVKTNMEEHVAATVHRYNLIAHFNHRHCKYIAQDKYGVKIRVEWINQGMPDPRLQYFPDHGNYHLNVSQRELHKLGPVFEFKCSFFNTTNQTIKITHGSILKGTASMYDIVNNDWLQSDGRVCLRPRSAYYNIHISFNIRDIICGKHSIPFGFDVIVESGTLYISRTIIINVTASEGWKVLAQPICKQRSPFVRWTPVDSVVAPLQRRKRGSDIYTIDDEVVQYMMASLKGYDEMRKERSVKEQEVCRTMKAGLRFDNYRDYFHNCLWVEEKFKVNEVDSFCLEKVCAKVTKEYDLLFIVPYLPNRRFTLLPGNPIRVKQHGSNEAFSGYIKKIYRSQVRVHRINLRLLDNLCLSKKPLIDIQFQLGRVPMERKHHGVEMVVKKKHMGMLFPDEVSSQRQESEFELKDEDFLNQNVPKNPAQRTAVINILNCSSQEAPYIVFGPPGTGKTATIVESICQILKKTDKKVLVCAPANAHCDMLTAKLMAYCNPNELCRAYSVSRQASAVPAELKQFTNIATNSNYFGHITPTYLNKFRIVISTLIFIGKFNDTRYTPDYIFIDEAAQASEPEVCVALSRLPKGGQLVLAGDPKQLKPLVLSNIAKEYGLNISLIQRLIASQKIYQNEDPRFISILRKNFRSHPNILQIPSSLFYEDKLEPASEKPLNDPISKIDVFSCLQNIIKDGGDAANLGKALEFCAVSAANRTDGISPSYFNSQEANMVVQYIKALLKLDITPIVKMSDIGVIAPYSQQVTKMKQLLDLNRFFGVDVGTIETFQGREKRIIILSTVRGQYDPLKCDNAYGLGFLKEPERINVAITRAISKLIIIGCPMVLGTDEKWNQIIRTCRALDTYHGIEPENRNDEEYLLCLEKFQKFSLLSEQLEKPSSTSLNNREIFDVIGSAPASITDIVSSDGSTHGESVGDPISSESANSSFFEIEEKDLEVIEGVSSDFEWVDSDRSNSAQSDMESDKQDLPLTEDSECCSGEDKPNVFGGLSEANKVELENRSNSAESDFVQIESDSESTKQDKLKLIEENEGSSADAEANVSGIHAETKEVADGVRPISVESDSVQTGSDSGSDREDLQKLMKDNASASNSDGETNKVDYVLIGSDSSSDKQNLPLSLKNNKYCSVCAGTSEKNRECLIARAENWFTTCIELNKVEPEIYSDSDPNDYFFRIRFGEQGSREFVNKNYNRFSGFFDYPGIKKIFLRSDNATDSNQGSSGGDLE